MNKKNPRLAIIAGSAVLGSVLLLQSACGDPNGPSGLIVVPAVPTGEEAPQLFRMNPDGTGLQQLTQGTGVGLPTDANDFPVLSRDRKTLVFASGRNFPPSSTSGDPDPMYRIAYVMDATGGSAHRLTNLDAKHYLEYPDDISPDGTWAVIEAANDGTSVPWILAGITRLYKAKMDGSSCELLIPADRLSQGGANLGCATFTGDGKSLLFLADDGMQCEIWKLDLATQRTTQITHEANVGSVVSWRIPMIAPGNDKLYFATWKHDPSSSSVNVINMDGTGEATVLTISRDPVSLGLMEDRFALSPEGHAFAFAYGAGQQSVAVTGLDGSGMKTVYPPSLFVGWGTLAWR